MNQLWQKSSKSNKFDKEKINLSHSRIFETWKKNPAMVYALWWQNSYIPGVTKKPTCVWKQTQLFIMVPSSSYGKWNYFARFCRIMMTDPYGTKSLLALAFFIDVCLSKHSKMTGWRHHDVTISDRSQTFK